MDVHVTDVYSDVVQSVIFSDQGSSSKPKEANKTEKSGKQVSDTSMFSQDDTPARKQKLNAATNIKELQFLHLEEYDAGFRMVLMASTT